MQQRQIVHIDLDSFFVSVECRNDSSLKGLPVVIGGGSDRGVVASCSYEARKFGIHSAMPTRMALQLCPHLKIVSGDYESYSKASAEVTQIISEGVPLFEKTSIDEFYIDLSGMDRFFGTFKLAQELREKVIHETGLPISFGLSQNKTVSKVATNLAKPNGYQKVDFGKEKSFLAPLAINKIPMIGEKTSTMLRRMGIVWVYTLQEMPPDLMESAFGKHGIMMWEKANGIDISPIVPYTERKSLSSENTFDKDTMDTKMLEALLVAMTESLCAKMRSENFLSSCVAVKIRYSDFNTFSQQIKIPFTAADHSIIPVVKELFKKLYNKRLMIRLIGVRFSNLVHGHHQINLFDDSLEQINLYQALDQLNQRYGDKTVCRAISMGLKTRSFNPFNGVAT